MVPGCPDGAAETGEVGETVVGEASVFLVAVACRDVVAGRQGLVAAAGDRHLPGGAPEEHPSGPAAAGEVEAATRGGLPRGHARWRRG